MVSVNTKSGPMDQIGKITSILSMNNGRNLVEIDITYSIANVSCFFYFQC